MLIRFVVNNFLSFNEEKEFNMIAGSFKTHKHHVYNLNKIDILKAAAIYGANGAGKSNFIKAIEQLQKIIVDGIINHSVNERKFKLDKSNLHKPTSFEIEFSVEKKPYIFGVSINNNEIIEEWLYESGITTEDKLIYERKIKNGKPSVKMAEKHTKTKKAKLLIELMQDNLLKNNELLLGKTDNLKIEEITKVRQWLTHKLVVIYPGSKYQSLVPPISRSKVFKNFANKLLKTFDTGVNELGIETIDFEKYFGEEDEDFKKQLLEAITNNKEVIVRTNKGGVVIIKENGKFVVKNVVALHRDSLGNKISFDLMEESDGTQRLLDFIPAFDGILSEDVTFIVDEIDQSLHPALLYSLVHKIMTDEETKGQLIFTTHESNLLDLEIFRQDEIWFAEKDKVSGGTQLYSLSEFKPRYDLDIRKGYLKGRFGAIPFLAKLEDLNWHSNGV